MRTLDVGIGQCPKCRQSIAFCVCESTSNDSKKNMALKKNRKKRYWPEDECQRCGNKNIVWFADSDLWNKYHGEYEILCPVCFAELAENRGLKTTGWKLIIESDDLTGRIIK